MTPYIEINELTKDYGHFRAVDRLSLRVLPGDIYGFLGPNGSGKSTTIRMILSLISPTSGEIKLFGEQLTAKRYQILNRVGALVEKSDFYNYLTARKNLQILGKLSAVPDLNRRVDEVLDQVGLLSRAESRVRTFSQGMKQRLGIAQTILHKPELIILDEPTNGLDPQGQKEIRELVKSLNQDFGITILISSHILYEIEQIANRMIIINKGKSLVEGSVFDLVTGQEQQVSFVVDNPDTLRQAIRETQWADKLQKSTPDRVWFKVTKDEIPDLSGFLFGRGIRIFAIEPVRSLEEFFLQLTENEATH
ncbi:MAG: ABC transporter ATP-binding protein [Bacteroidales bacterium]|jgi:ABC-2 type transport system ATP-binding protein|nr:ABC transporter ATP-binding protein [Bacteroidales bacterium]MDD2812896.1 ABC transporter ATP-binding protein [Bacteroidales bacterium]MDD4813085.1 ABC transporter ATP-binding protein [Bacteroidales bacterium]NLO69005.1 ABC transporter ATP-binding protein [Bacteroidales bacterium]